MHKESASSFRGWRGWLAGLATSSGQQRRARTWYLRICAPAHGRKARPATSCKAMARRARPVGVELLGTQELRATIVGNHGAHLVASQHLVSLTRPCNDDEHPRRRSLPRKNESTIRGSHAKCAHPGPRASHVNLRLRQTAPDHSHAGRLRASSCAPHVKAHDSACLEKSRSRYATSHHTLCRGES